MDDKNYKSILMQSPFGFAYHKIIVDKNDQPVDYEFLEVNPAFERITGLKAKEIIGKTVCQVLPGIRKGNFDWVQYYGDIALDGGESEFEQYSKPLGSWYKVHAYSDQKYYFSTVFTDISAQKSLSDIATTFNNFTAQTIDMQYVVDKAREISGATYAVLNKFDENGRDFSTIAFSGINKHLEKAISMFGFDPRGKKWDYDPERQKKIDKQKTTIFQQLTDLTGTTIPEKIITLLSKTFNIGQVAVVKTTRENTMIGDFVLFFKRGSQLQNRETLETYADLTGMLLSRIDEERKVINEKTRLKTITDNMTDLVWETDLQLKNIYISPSVERILGFSVEEYMPLTIEKRCKPESLQTMLPLLQEELEKENDPHVNKSRSRLVELEYYKKDGSIIPMESNISFVRDKNGKLVGLRGVSRDITERKFVEQASKQAEEVLRESEEKHRMLFENAPDSILLLDKKGNIIDCNSATENSLEWDRDEIIGKHVTEFIKDDDKHLFKENFPVLIEKGTLQLELRLTTKSKKTVHVWRKINGLTNAKDEFIGCIIHTRDITERKQAEEALLESEARWQFAVDGSALGLWDWNVQTSEVFFSKQWKAMLGFKDDEISESLEEWDKRVHPDDKEKVYADINKHLDGKAEFYNIEHRVLCKNNSYKWILDRGKVISQSDDGKPLRMIGTHTDITERKQAEDELKESKEHLELSLEGGDLGTWDWNIKTGRVDFNERWAEMKGYKLDDLKPDLSTWEKLVHPDDLKMVYGILNEHLEGKAKSYMAEFRMKHKSGKWLWIIDKGKVITRDEKGNPVRVCGTHLDITERKQAEEKLIESEEKYRLLIQNSPDITVLQASDGRPTFISPQIEHILGYKPEEFAAINIFDIIHPDDKDRTVKAHENAFTGNDLVEFEYRVKNKTGQYRWLSHTARPMFSDGKLQNVHSNIRDITERKQAQQELIKAKEKAEESDRLKSAFLANMSHEIRTPMNGILGFSDLLKEPGLTGDVQQEYIRIIEKSGKRMLNIINDIVDISKIEAGLMKLNISESNINEQIEYTYTFFEPEAETKGIKLSFKNSLAAKEAIINTDREKLYAILTNLVKNAIKYTKEGTIEFGYNMVETQSIAALQFYVKDTGIGIPQNRQGAIFERFIQSDIEDKQAYQGAGLGLGISKAYVEMLGGKIWVESEEGIGSTFYFTLPYNAEPTKESNGHQPVVSEKNNDVRKLKILIAEDDEVSEMLIDNYIKMFGKEILKARTGIEAVEICRNNPDIDLILMDICMPQMSGYEATRQIREFNKEVVIIAQTAYGLSGDKEKAIEAGCNDYIAKPIKKMELQAMIQKYFAK